MFNLCPLWCVIVHILGKKECILYNILMSVRKNKSFFGSWLNLKVLLNPTYKQMGSKYIGKVLTHILSHITDYGLGWRQLIAVTSFNSLNVCLFFWQFQYQTLSFCFVLYKCSYKVNNKAAAVCRYFSIALITTCICRFAAVLKFTASCDQEELKWRKSSGDGAFSLSLCLVCYFFWGCHCTYGNRTCCHQPHWCRFTSLVSPRVTKWVRSSKRRCTQTESVTNGVNIISSRLTL